MFRIKQIPRLLVASTDGYLYIYNLDKNEGGECALVKQHRYTVVNAYLPFKYIENVENNTPLRAKHANQQEVPDLYRFRMRIN